MENNLLLIIFLFMLVAMLTMVSHKLRISYAIMLVLSGLIIGMLPAGPDIILDPEFAFIIFLPPLLFEAAWNSSWKDLFRHRRSILRLALGLVVFTSFAVAFVAHEMIPGFTLALGVLLGGIVSPPDAVAATSVMKGLNVPRRVKAVLEGESLINDASSLIVFSFALQTVITKKFVWWQAGIDFVWVSVGGVVIGLAIAYVVYLFLKYLPTSASIDTIITFITPYLSYLAAEHFHFSGVLAVVSGGLFLNSKASLILPYNSRIQMSNVWETVVFLMNGAIFTLIGLQLPHIKQQLGPESLHKAIWYGVAISLTAIVVRFIWVYLISGGIEWIRGKLGAKDSYNPMDKRHRRQYFVIAWSGMRGVVSLASALSIPITLSGKDFPFRNMILFITFIVILITLVVQGLLLPFIIKWLKLEETGNDSSKKLSLEMDMAEKSLQYMNEHYAHDIQSSELFRRLRDRYMLTLEESEEEPVVREASSRVATYSKYVRMQLELIEVKRQELNRLLITDKYPEYIIRNKENELDLEEARIRKAN